MDLDGEEPPRLPSPIWRSEELFLSITKFIDNIDDVLCKNDSNLPAKFQLKLRDTPFCVNYRTIVFLAFRVYGELNATKM